MGVELPLEELEELPVVGFEDPESYAGGLTRPGPLQEPVTVSKLLKTTAPLVVEPYVTMLFPIEAAAMFEAKTGTLPVTDTTSSLFDLLGLILNRRVDPSLT